MGDEVAAVVVRDFKIAAASANITCFIHPPVIVPRLRTKA
jgi:hypothetical protein